MWLGPVTGGRAWRVSADQAQASHPRISGDGMMIAWTSARGGSPEVYLADVEGGNARRLTYFGDPQTRVCGWDPGRGDPGYHRGWPAVQPVHLGVRDLRRLRRGRCRRGRRRPGRHRAGRPGRRRRPAAAGRLRRLPFGPVNDLSVQAATVALLTGAMGREPAYWKRYRGGSSGRLWVAAGPAASRSPASRSPAARRAARWPAAGGSARSPACWLTCPATSPARCWPGGGSRSCPIMRAPATCTRARSMAATCGGTPTMTASMPAARAPTGAGSPTIAPATSGCLTRLTRPASPGGWSSASARRAPGGPGG